MYRTSRFQNAGWTYSEDISANPMSRKSLLTWELSLESICFLAAYTEGAKVWMSYFLNSAPRHSPLWMMRSVTSVIWGFSSIPEAAASFPRGVSSTLRSVTVFSAIMPWRPFRSLMMALSASASGTGACAILARSSSSGMRESFSAFPFSVRTRALDSPSLTMSASPFLLSHPTATLSIPPDIFSASSSMPMRPPFAEMRFTAALSGRPSSTTDASPSTKNFSVDSAIFARPLDSSHDAAPMASTSRENAPSAIMLPTVTGPSAPSKTIRSLFSL